MKLITLTKSQIQQLRNSPTQLLIRLSRDSAIWGMGAYYLHPISYDGQGIYTLGIYFDQKGRANAKATAADYLISEVPANFKGAKFVVVDPAFKLKKAELKVIPYEQVIQTARTVSLAALQEPPKQVTIFRLRIIILLFLIVMVIFIAMYFHLDEFFKGR